MVWYVCGSDHLGNMWIVRTEIKETANSIQDKFIKDGYKNVHITNNPPL